MNKVRKKKDEQERKPTAVSGLLKPLLSLLNGTFLTREKVLSNMPFILYLAFLMIGYIAYGYFTERTVRDLQSTDRELKELRSEYITIRSELEQTEQQSQVAADISALGLKESRVPPHKIEVDKGLITNNTALKP